MIPTHVSAMDIAHALPDDAHLLTVGMTLVGASESILAAIEERFLATGHPRNLTLIHCAGQSNRVAGIQHLAHEGLVGRIIGSHWGLAPRWMEFISSNTVTAYCMPQGQMTHWLRSMAAGMPGHLTPVGLGTFVDPRIEGGKMNDRTRKHPDLVRLVEVFGKEYLWFEGVPIDWVLIRGTEADPMGNLSAKEEAMKLELLPAVFAGRRWEGKIVAQVKRIVDRGMIPPRQVEVPGVHIDFIVRADDPDTQHRQTSGWVYDPNFSEMGFRPTEIATDESEGDMDVRRLIGRRAVFELRLNDIINVGTGIPNDVIGSVLRRECVTDLVNLTVESGVYGGTPVGGVDFGISRNPDALIEHPYQFDFYNGRGVDITFMGFAEVDADGNVNATKFGDRAAGAGGFIDITQSARRVVFLGTLTAQGTDIRIHSGGIQIVNEGRVSKFVSAVQQISFNGQLALQRGQAVTVVTERAVLRLGEHGWIVEEIAPGIDLNRDVLNHMAFVPQISHHLRTMSAGIFSSEALNLRDLLGKTQEQQERSHSNG